MHGKLQRFPPISVRPEYVTQSAYANECLSVCLSHSLCPSVLHMQWSWVSPPACGRISMRCSADTCGTEAAPPAPALPKHPLPSHTHTHTLFAPVCESEMPELKSHFKSSSPCPTTLVVCLVWPSAHDSQSQSPQISNNKSHNYGAAAVQLQVQVQELE